MIGIAFGMVLLPEITRLLNSDKEGEARATMVSGLELAMIVTVPAAIALMVIPRRLSRLFLREGRLQIRIHFKPGVRLGPLRLACRDMF
jgi:putative peptidoglycan lipid II flippase